MIPKSQLLRQLAFFSFTEHDGTEARLVKCTPLFEETVLEE